MGLLHVFFHNHVSLIPLFTIYHIHHFNMCTSNLFRDCRHQGDGQTHPLSSADTPNTMDIVALFVRQRHIDDERQA